jgi:hypothetical protein
VLLHNLGTTAPKARGITVTSGKDAMKRMHQATPILFGRNGVEQNRLSRYWSMGLLAAKGERKCL